MKDYKLIGGYERFKNELDIGVEYKKNGFYTVIIENPAVEDIGLDRTIIDPTRKWPKTKKNKRSKGIEKTLEAYKKNEILKLKISFLFQFFPNFYVIIGVSFHVRLFLYFLNFFLSFKIFTKISFKFRQIFFLNDV